MTICNIKRRKDMEFLKTLVHLEKVSASLTPALSKRQGLYLGKVTDVDDPLGYGRVKAVTLEGSVTGWLNKASNDVPSVGEDIVVAYTSDVGVGIFLACLHPRLVERITVPEGETQPDGITENWSSPRMSEFPEP
jgi:hypothetical protein